MGATIPRKGNPTAVAVSRHVRGGNIRALTGFCRQCAQYVYLTEQWGCINGHAWNEISGWYDPQTGAPVTPP